MTLAEVDPELWRQLSSYLDYALDLEEPERERWLTELATSKPAIAATLRELVSEREALNASRFLERSPLATAARKAVLRSPAGRPLNAYSLDRLLAYCVKRRISIRERVKLFISAVGKGWEPSGELRRTTTMPEYIAPELLLGGSVSAAGDVYQLGMLLYVLLTGAHPLQLAGGRTDRMMAALAGRIPRASHFAWGIARLELRGDLDAILVRALHMDQHERYATSAELRADLVRYLNREPVEARSGTLAYRVRKFVARHLLGATEQRLNP
jgi:serine/threonine protein kinase